jgi:threonine aldolase
MLGGGMRQAGILAAAALYALDHHVEPLADDHLHAQKLAEALVASSWATVPVPPETNIVFARVQGHDANDVVAKLAALGVRTSAMGAGSIRLVTHRDVTPVQTNRVCEILRTLF